MGKWLLQVPTEFFQTQSVAGKWKKLASPLSGPKRRPKWLLQVPTEFFQTQSVAVKWRKLGSDLTPSQMPYFQQAKFRR